MNVDELYKQVRILRSQKQLASMIVCRLDKKIKKLKETIQALKASTR